MHGPLGPEAEDIARVEGVWQATELVTDGIKIDEDISAQTTLELQNGNFTLRDAGILRGHFTLDSGMEPKWIDLEVADGPKKGGKYLGIYKWEDDKLVICLAAIGFVAGEARFRPQEFSAQRGTGQTMIVLRRKKN